MNKRETEQKELEVIGEGVRSRVVRDRAFPGKVLKIPHNQTSTPIGDMRGNLPAAADTLEDERNKYAVLNTVPGVLTTDFTITTITLPNGTRKLVGVMDDYTSGDQNFVINIPDLFVLQSRGAAKAIVRESEREGFNYNEAAEKGRAEAREKVKLTVAKRLEERPRITTPEQFCAQLKTMIQNMESHVVTVNNGMFDYNKIDGIGFPDGGNGGIPSALFMILTSDGRLETRIADAEDGITLHANTSPVYSDKSCKRYIPVERYLTEVILLFFPDFKEQAKLLMAELSKGSTDGEYPLALVGETDPHKRQRLLDSIGRDRRLTSE